MQRIAHLGARPGLIAIGTLLFGLVATGITGPASAAESYFLDKEHSEIRFYYSHGGVSEQSGEFLSFKGDAVFDREDFAKSSVSIEIAAASVTSGVPHLDGQLKNSYYFSVKEHPTITYQSREVRQVGERHALIFGDLTIRGVTKPVTLEVELRHDGEHPVGQSIAFYKGQWIGIHATASVLRSEFGMTSYIPVISDRILIEINAELKARKK
ncbi:MAG: YceI family protein [Pseudomonadota bacterium]